MIVRACIVGPRRRRAAGAALASACLARPRRWRAAALVLALAVVGCTPIPRVATRPGLRVPGVDSTRVAPGKRPVPRPARPVAAVVDSAPSPAALVVLSSIPEPLAPEERVPPPEITPAAQDSSATDAAPADSAAEAPADSPTDTTGDVPVPTPTPKLGDIVNPGLDPARDTTATRADSARGVTPPLPKPRAGAPAGPATPPAREKTPPAPAAACWRVQIMAPKEKAEAARKRSAAESILLIPMVVERDAGLYKIRTRECFTRATADVVRGRAVASGFLGAFPFESVKR